MSDVIIIGAGPAGISAAIYAARGGADVTVIAKDSGALSKTEKIENYYGFASPVAGKALFEAGIEQARSLGVEIVTDEVLSLDFDGGFTAKCVNGEYRAAYSVIATGVSRAAPKIPGFKELEGRRVSYCAVCDAFFFRGKSVAVLGNGEYALEEANVLLKTAASVTVLTDGKEPQADFTDNIKIVTAPLSRICGEDRVTGIELEGGELLPLDGIFTAIGTAGATALARKLGAALSGNSIVIDANGETTVKGLFAAGDCTGGMLQIAKAVYEGARVGQYISRNLRNPKSGASS